MCTRDVLFHIFTPINLQYYSTECLPSAYTHACVVLCIVSVTRCPNVYQALLLAQNIAMMLNEVSSNPKKISKLKINPSNKNIIVKRNCRQTCTLFWSI